MEHRYIAKLLFKPFAFYSVFGLNLTIRLHGTINESDFFKVKRKREREREKAYLSRNITGA